MPNTLERDVSTKEDGAPKIKIAQTLAKLFGVEESQLGYAFLRREGAGWRLECTLRRTPNELLVAVSPSASTPTALVRGAHLSCSHLAEASRDDARWLARTRPMLDSDLARVLATLISTGDLSAATDPDNVVATANVERLAPSDTALTATLDGFRQHFGVSARLVTMASSDHLPSVEYPPVPTLNRVFAQIGSLARSEGPIRSYLNSIGYSASADGLLRTVPTPTTFLRRCRDLGITPAFEPRLIRQLRRELPLRSWLQHLIQGRFLINVGRPSLYAYFQALRRLRWERPAESEIQSHLTLLGHDMSTHVFAVHRVPQPRAAEIRRRIAAAMPRATDVASTRSLTPLADFFEGDLTYGCLRIWGDLRHPDDFGAAFEDAWPGTERQLSARIDACRRIQRSGQSQGRRSL